MALLFTVLCGAAATALGFFINYFTKGHFVHSTESVIDTQIAYVEALGLEQAKLKTSGLYIPIENDASLPENIQSDIAVLTEGIIVFDSEDGEKQFAAKVYSYPDGKRLLVGTDITRVTRDFKFMQRLGIGSIIFVTLVVFVSYIISIFVVSGTNQIADTARQIINTGDLSRRLDIGKGWDDLSNMANVLNLLLDRIEELMLGVKQVSDNIAHDLRLPLTRLRNHIESLEPSPEHAELMQEVDQLMTTFNALLRISRIEQEQQRDQFTQLELSQLLTDVVELYEPLAESRTITIKKQLIPYSIKGDRDLLFQAYANLLDNALKYSPDNSTVEISMQKTATSLTVSVKDTGKGVEAKALDKIFDRFYRTDTARHTPGNGLGLALVKAVIELHNGQIRAEQCHPGFKIITDL
jgi:signal transduction histidine kinase